MPTILRVLRILSLYRRSGDATKTARVWLVFNKKMGNCTIKFYIVIQNFFMKNVFWNSNFLPTISRVLRIPSRYRRSGTATKTARVCLFFNKKIWNLVIKFYIVVRNFFRKNFFFWNLIFCKNTSHFREIWNSFETLNTWF